MSVKSFFLILSSSLRDLFRNPFIVVPSVLIFLLLFLLSKVSLFINSGSFLKISPNVSFTIFSVAYFSIIAYFMSSLIGFSFDIRHGKPFLRNLFRYSNKFFLRNLAILLLIFFLSWVATFVITPVVFFPGKAIGLSESSAQIVFFLLYFIFLAGFVLFISFASFFLILRDSSLIESFLLSKKFVSRNYLQTLSLIILFFIVFSLLYYFKSPVSTFIEYFLALPYSSLVLSRFILSEK